MPEGDDDVVVAEIPVNNGVLRVLTDDTGDDWADYSCGPAMGIGLRFETSENGCVIELGYLDLEERDCMDLIAALTKGLEIEREKARRRGFYDWRAAGSPSLETQPNHPFFQT